VLGAEDGPLLYAYDAADADCLFESCFDGPGVTMFIVQLLRALQGITPAAQGCLVSCSTLDDDAVRHAARRLVLNGSADSSIATSLPAPDGEVSAAGGACPEDEACAKTEVSSTLTLMLLEVS
jgi:hypothetical protein